MINKQKDKILPKIIDRRNVFQALEEKSNNRYRFETFYYIYQKNCLNLFSGECT
jgi:hypothetical protein